jgi:uncharacterized protein
LNKGENVISQELIEAIRQGFALDWNGVHGVSHWERVRANGLRLARLTGAKAEIVELFAFLHDSKRLNNKWDPGHGKRAADFIETLQGTLITLPGDDLALLTYACEYHTDGLLQADVTVQTCWDADRLDLGRAGITPQARYLCTPAAKDPALIEWAIARSMKAAGKPAPSKRRPQ